MERLQEMTCQCETTDPKNIQLYTNNKNKLIGAFCKECRVENLVLKYPIDDEDNSNPLVQRKPFMVEFQVQSCWQSIPLQSCKDILKPGDHIAWNRRKLYYHHAIVEEVNTSKNTISVIHWTKRDEDKRFKIVSEIKNVDEKIDGMYRINYPERIVEANDTELVLARARSRRNDTGYSPTHDNCESFATFCKCGVEKSHQVVRFCRKVIELVSKVISGLWQPLLKPAIRKIWGKREYIAKQVWKFGAENWKTSIIPSETIEHYVTGSSWTGTCIVICIGGFCVVLDLIQAYRERINGNISIDEFIEEAIRILEEGLVAIGFTIAGGLLIPKLAGWALGTPFGPAGVIACGIAGDIFGDLIMPKIEIDVRNLIGGFMSTLLHKKERAIKEIQYLEPGDHIVLYAWLLHPRCHAIVIEHNCSDKIKVIFNSYQNGVVEVWVSFSQPLYKVKYPPNTCYDQKDVISNARNKIGERQYDLATYNCKTFARRCKLKTGSR